MKTKEFGGTIHEVYTEQDWECDGTLQVKEGQLIEPAVYFQLLNSMPPVAYGCGIFQPGEAYGYDFQTGRMTYQTFEHMGKDYYKYIGLQVASRHTR